jgi:hypothetical protein
VSVIEKVGSMVKAGDMSAFEGMLASAICVSPFDGDKSKLKAYYQKHPSRYVDDLGKLKDNLPQYGGNKPLNTTNNLILNLGELSLKQKQDLLAKKLKELGITEDMIRGEQEKDGQDGMEEGIRQFTGYRTARSEGAEGRPTTKSLPAS